MLFQADSVAINVFHDARVVILVHCDELAVVLAGDDGRRPWLVIDERELAKAFAFEQYLKSASGRAFAKKRL